jgi:hypothetical protein
MLYMFEEYIYEFPEVKNYKCTETTVALEYL